MGWFTSLRSNVAVGPRLQGMGRAFMSSISQGDRALFAGMVGQRRFAPGFDVGVEVGKVARRAMGRAARPGLAGAGIGAAGGVVMADDDHRVAGAVKGGILGGGVGLAGGILRNNIGTASSMARGFRL